MSEARPEEPIIDPLLPICDGHHHLWTYAQNPWLPERFAEATGGHRVLSSVHVECRHGWRDSGPDELRPVGETEFVAACTAEPVNGIRIAAGIVAFADLRLGEAVEPVLDAHLAASERVRGLRYMTAWDASEQVRNAQTEPPPGLLADPQFRAGLRCLITRGLSFDAWVYHPQIPEVTALAQALPELVIVLNHVGGPLGIGPYAGRRDEVFAAWQAAMRELATCPNVCVKLGGLTMPLAGFGWHKRATPPDSEELADALGPWYRFCIETFGPQRCLFESNFPIDSTACSYVTLWNAFKRITAGLSAEDRAALFHDTAVRVYRLDA
ncbi:MAG: amidohydrolase [Gammaproteobacteria bacterium]|nr:MAG: amidohydrolase [Gammaproteobacteria bacterium]